MKWSFLSVNEGLLSSWIYTINLHSYYITMRAPYVYKPTCSLCIHCCRLTGGEDVVQSPDSSVKSTAHGRESWTNPVVQAVLEVPATMAGSAPGYQNSKRGCRQQTYSLLHVFIIYAAYDFYFYFFPLTIIVLLPRRIWI